MSALKPSVRREKRKLDIIVGFVQRISRAEGPFARIRERKAAHTAFKKRRKTMQNECGCEGCGAPCEGAEAYICEECGRGYCAACAGGGVCPRCCGRLRRPS